MAPQVIRDEEMGSLTDRLRMPMITEEQETEPAGALSSAAG